MIQDVARNGRERSTVFSNHGGFENSLVPAGRGWAASGKRTRIPRGGDRRLDTPPFPSAETV